MKTHAKKMVSFLVFHFESGPWNPRKDVLCIHYPLSPSYLIHHINQFESSLETLVTKAKNSEIHPAVLWRWVVVGCLALALRLVSVVLPKLAGRNHQSCQRVGCWCCYA